MTNGVPACDGWCRNSGDPPTGPVTHIGEKGYVYCAKCAPKRRLGGYERVRKMRKWELDLIRAGKPLPSYEPRPKPAVLP